MVVIFNSPLSAIGNVAMAYPQQQQGGPVNAVPVSVRTMEDNVISITPDPAKTKDHFGNTSIYGTIIKDVRIKK
jgi:hypothetical protein